MAVTALATLVLFIFLLPMFYGIATALKNDAQIAQLGAPWWPGTAATYTYEGKEYEVYRVPIGDEVRDLALVKKAATSVILSILSIQKPVLSNGRGHGGDSIVPGSLIRNGTTLWMPGRASSSQSCCSIR
jgi:ABC-type glycerol-3-phosphate transport system permease component